MSEMLSVQTGVPIPKRSRTSGGSRPRKYPFEVMEPGQMFFIPNKTKNTMHTYFSSVSKKIGIKLSSRKLHMRQVDNAWEPCEPTDEGAVYGIGVWRVD